MYQGLVTGLFKSSTCGRPKALPIAETDRVMGNIDGPRNKVEALRGM